MPRLKNPSPFLKIRTRSILKSAWDHIYEKGRNSNGVETRIAVTKFKEAEDTNINRIHSRLRKGQYLFKPAKAVLQGKKKRPLIIPVVEDRIVQRALLLVLQGIPEIRNFVHVPNSFGAIEGLGVPDAVLEFVKTINQGATYFYKSDIKEFFTRIPRPKVIGLLSDMVKDEEFIDLVDQASNAEVCNLAAVGDYKKYFDYNEIGTPQGCCLSPLFGNILLNQFDHEMNHGDIVCLRYLDDFLILGPTGKAVNAAFRRAKKILESNGLEPYDALDGLGKAKFGHIAQGFEYLGLDISEKRIRPSAAARKNILGSIESILKESLTVDFGKISDNSKEDFSFIKTLSQVSNKLKGWGNQYFFCNDDVLWSWMDKEINRLIEDYRKAYNNRKFRLKKAVKKSWVAERRLLGVHLFIDNKTRPNEYDLQP